VVLLLPLYVTYQGYISEVDLKYGDRDITSGSLVFRCSKDNEASGEPLPEHIYTPKLKFTMFNVKIKNNKYKRKCSPVTDERCVLSNGMSIATCNSQNQVIQLKNF